MIEICLNISLACRKHFFFTRNLGLSRKHLYINGRDINIGAAIITNVYLQLGERLTIGKKIGAPAQTIVKMLIDIVLNLIAILFYCYPTFQRYSCIQLFRTQTGRIQ